MTQIIVLPHVELCPDGAVIEAAPGTSICDALLGSDIEIEHACEKSCACTTCHVVVREGFNSLWRQAEELEEDLLDKAWGLEPSSRLSLPGAGRQCAAGDRDSEIHHQHGQGRAFEEMKWTDSLEIAIQLSEAHPEVDPTRLNFVDLMRWVMALPGFEENESHCGEKKLEAIQQAWIDEQD
jgi:2Fe-2S ferredoxin